MNDTVGSRAIWSSSRGLGCTCNQCVITIALFDVSPQHGTSMALVVSSGIRPICPSNGSFLMNHNTAGAETLMTCMFFIKNQCIFLKVVPMHSKHKISLIADHRFAHGKFTVRLLFTLSLSCFACLFFRFVKTVELKRLRRSSSEQ